MSDFSVRIPFVENLATQYGHILASSRRWLTQSEKNIGRLIFQSSIDLDAVQIVETGVVNAPTTLGNYIRVNPGYHMDDATLIHELTHVWQYQTQGNRYISDSLYHQTVATIRHGSRDAAYSVTIVPGQSFYRYSAEHQAVIAETYFSNIRKRNDPNYTRMIREVRSARPILSRTYRYYESLYGPCNWQQEQFDSLHPHLIPVERTMPIIRFEW